MNVTKTKGWFENDEFQRYDCDFNGSSIWDGTVVCRKFCRIGRKRCVCVSPGPVLTRASMANMKTLLGRAAEPQEIIDLILFIASDKGQFINGENIMIDGGRNAMGRKV